MITIRELEERRSELTGLKELLSSATDDTFEKPLLRSKIAQKERELQESERQPTIPIPEVELLFSGRAVAGSLGIEAKFAGSVLESYQDMVSNHYGARIHPGMGGAGRRPGEQESRLFLAALPRGSFGLLLKQPSAIDFVAAQNVVEALEELTSLVEAAAAGDAAFSQGVAHFHPRVLVPLRKFFDALASRDSSVVIRSGGRATNLQPEQIQQAKTRVYATETMTEEIEMNGVFRGILLESWKFDFVPDGAAPISGSVSDSVSESEAQAMLRLCDLRCKASLQKTQFSTHGNMSRPTYELRSLQPGTENPPDNETG